MHKNAIRHRLLNNSITHESPIGRGVTSPVFAELGNEFNAVLKDDSVNKEVGAYMLNNFMGLDIVPVTVKRACMSSIKGSDNFSLQQFINNGETISDNWDLLDFESVAEQINVIRVFDYILGNIDRHKGNLLVDKETTKVWAIDNGYAFWISASNQSDTDSFNTCSFSLIEVMDVVCKNVDLYNAIKKIKRNKAYVSKRLADYFGEDNLTDMFIRVDKILNAYDTHVVS